MKIVLLPGVGFNSDKELYDNFLNGITKELGCEGEVCYWKHDWPLPKITLPYISLRRWISEVILDFQQVVDHAFTTPVPKADYYIGHSAGTILALAQESTPCVLMGSPAVLVECVGNTKKAIDSFGGRFMEIITNERPVLNIVHKYDQLAYPLDHDNIENYIYRGPLFAIKTYNPYKAHEDYWKRKKVREKIISTIKSWESK